MKRTVNSWVGSGAEQVDAPTASPFTGPSGGATPLPSSRLMRRASDWRVLFSTATLPLVVLTGCGTPPSGNDTCATYYADADADSYGSASTVSVCAGQAVPAGYITRGGDCNDQDAAIRPGVAELCDLVDNDCNAVVDESGRSYFRDVDHDGFGGRDKVSACSAPDGYVESSSDCNDSDAATHPDASELCDGRDNNCDSVLPSNEQDTAGNGQLLCEAVVSFMDELDVITLEQGQTRNLTIPVRLDVGSEGSDYAIDFNSEVVPFDPILDNSLKSVFPFGVAYERSTEGLIHLSLKTSGVDENGDQLFTPVGSYQLPISADTSNGTVDVIQIRIDVLEPGALRERLALTTIGTTPDALEIAADSHETTLVTFTVNATGPRILPDSISLERLSGSVWEYVGELFDDGQDNDAAGDGVYSGQFEVARGLDEGAQRFRTRAFQSVDIAVSPEKVLPTSVFPVGVFGAILEAANLTSDVNGYGEKVLCNQLSVSFVPGTTSAQIEEIVENLNGAEIVGYLPALSTYQIEFPLGLCNMSLLQQRVDAFYASSELIEEVALEPITTINSDLTSTPNDSSYSAQGNMRAVHAQGAWLISQGSIIIGNVDTGVDYNHTELPLTTKVIKGKDTVSGDSDPYDTDGHGTHTSGIMAALSNNANGVAGVSWSSKILAVRGLGGTVTQMAAGIQYAADQGAKIINISGGSDSNQTVLSNAITYAYGKGSLVFASTGGGSKSSPRYPAYYSQAVAVTGTTDSDAKTTGRFGTWVDMAAPSENVISTDLGGGYRIRTGTSQAAALAAGAAAVISSMNPSWTITQVRNRLEKTCKPLPAEWQYGKGRVDLLEAVFNGNFELGNMEEWTATGTCSIVSSVAGILPPTDGGKYMAFCSTGPGDSLSETLLENEIIVNRDVDAVTVSFDYNIMTEEFPEWVDNIYDDSVSATLVKPDATETDVMLVTINDLGFDDPEDPDDGFLSDLPGFDLNTVSGDTTVGASGWRTASVQVPIVNGTGRFKVTVSDFGDALVDTAVLIDRVRFE